MRQLARSVSVRLSSESGFSRWGSGCSDRLLWRGGASRKRGGILRRAVADPLAGLHGPGLGGVVEGEVVEVGGRVRERLLLCQARDRALS